MNRKSTINSKGTPIIILTQKTNIIRVDFGQFGPTSYIIPNRSLVVKKSKINENFQL
jgi:hypothetical protein